MQGENKNPAYASEVEAAFAYCTRLATEHYENFPVGSWMIPKNKRKYVHAIYAFARTADDMADEQPHPHPDPPSCLPPQKRGEGFGRNLIAALPEGEGISLPFKGRARVGMGLFLDNNAAKTRLHLLDEWEKQLYNCIDGKPEHPIFIALKETLTTFAIPAGLLKDLITAFRMDTVNKRYRKMEDVLTYCRYSANPVGRIVLYLFGYKDPGLHRLSDFICTALQLTNFWQDIAIDLEKDRIYIPLEDMEKFGYTEDELMSHTFNDGFKNLLAYETGYTKGLFTKGLPLCSMVEGGLSLELKAVWSGGMKILEKLEHNGYDIFNKRPVITAMDKLKIVSRALTMRQKKNEESI
ncbi:MAG: squalene synthase HpnC [Nitrospirae bacterium]|nr:squalene synthase HpnC [Nitrospirota bacterium]